jgi:DNA-binding transcriptional LysR family regulator
MEIRVLRYFIAVVQEGSISAAAKFLHLSQPTLSRQLRELEEELGVVLFDRGNRYITLTEKGAFFLQQAREIITLVDKTSSNLQTDAISGDVYIGCGESEAVKMITDVYTDILKTHSDVRLHLFSGNSEQLGEKMDRGLLDFSFVIGRIDQSKHDFIKLAKQDQWGVLMRKDNPFSSKKSIRKEELSSLPLIISNQPRASEEISNWLLHDVFDLRIIATYNLLYNASLLVQSGAGFAICLDGILNTTGESPLCFRPLDPPLLADLAFIWKKHKPLSQAAKLFLSELKKVTSTHKNAL